MRVCGLKLLNGNPGIANWFRKRKSQVSRVCGARSLFDGLEKGGDQGLIELGFRKRNTVRRVALEAAFLNKKSLFCWSTTFRNDRLLFVRRLGLSQADEEKKRGEGERGAGKVTL